VTVYVICAQYNYLKGKFVKFSVDKWFSIIPFDDDNVVKYNLETLKSIKCITITEIL
jgi:hypothetical protein